MKGHSPEARPGFTLTVAGGKRLFVGPVLPEDAWRLRGGLEEMSQESRYLRFFTGLKQFSDEQVQYFTEVDQVNHVAWGALDPTRPNWPGVAIARFARLGDDPHKAEWAIAIIDAFQHHGLGSRLLAILYLEAEARGIDVLTALVLPENRFVLDWLARLGADIRRQPEAYVIDVPVDRRDPLLFDSQTGRRFLSLLEDLEPRVRALRTDPTS